MIFPEDLSIRKYFKTEDQIGVSPNGGTKWGQSKWGQSIIFIILLLYNPHTYSDSGDKYYIINIID